MLLGRAALFMRRNPAGGKRSKRVVDGSITRYLKNNARPLHLRCVLMSVMIHSPHKLTKNPYMDAMLSGLRSYSPPAQNAMLHHLVQLHSCTFMAVRARLRDIKKLFCGLPFLHLVTDLWTERHSHQSFGFFVVR